MDNKDLNKFIALNDMIGDICGCQNLIKNVCLLIDYQMPSGEYKWKDVYIGIPQHWSEKDIMNNISDIAISSGISKKARIGCVAISYDLFDTEKIAAIEKEHYETGEMSDRAKELSEHFKPLFFDPTY